MSTACLDVRSIIKRAGGPKGLHAHVQELAKVGKLNPDQVVAEKTIYSWFEGGIPERHWSVVMPACGVTESQLHRANEVLRRTRLKVA